MTRRRIMPAIVVMVLAAPWVVAEEPPSTALDIEELIRRADPTRDDWAAESLERGAAAQLESLARLFAHGPVDTGTLEGVADRDARATPLRPPGLTRRRTTGGIVVARLATPAPSKASGPLVDALNDLVEPFREAGYTRIEFKIVEIEQRAAKTFETLVRYEAAARIARSTVQQTAYWRVDWSWANEDGPPTIAGVRLESFEELSSPAPVFEDRTFGILPAGVWYPRLAFGGNYWYGRTDSLGESNLMGHNGIAIGDGRFADASFSTGLDFRDPDNEGFFDTYEVVNNQSPYFISVGDLNH